MFFDPRKYDFSRVGRLKFNIKLGLETPLDTRTLDSADFVAAIKYLLKLRKNIGTVDDIDHWAIAASARSANCSKTSSASAWSAWSAPSRKRCRVYQEMSTAMPHDLVNAKPVMAAIREFFGSSQLRSSWTRPTRSAKSPTSGVFRLLGPAVFRANAPGSKSATFTPRTTAASARLKRRKVRTSA